MLLTKLLTWTQAHPDIRIIIDSHECRMRGTQSKALEFSRTSSYVSDPPKKPLDSCLSCNINKSKSFPKTASVERFVRLTFVFTDFMKIPSMSHPSMMSYHVRQEEQWYTCMYNFSDAQVYASGLHKGNIWRTRASSKKKERIFKQDHNGERINWYNQKRRGIGIGGVSEGAQVVEKKKEYTSFNFFFGFPERR